MFKELGYHSTDRLVIINADDFGITESTNQAIFHLLQQNSITSASIMIPCFKAYEASLMCKQIETANVGVHLTLTSAENHCYKPVYQKRRLSSLVTEDGFFPHDAATVAQAADPEEVKMELEAQIQTAISWGIEPTHLDSHAGSVLGLFHGRDFLEIVFDLCEKYALPFNLPTRILEQPIFNEAQKELFSTRINSAKRRGIQLIDDQAGLSYSSHDAEEYRDLVKEITNQIINFRPGITQIVTHPSVVTAELKALTPYYRKRELEYRLFSDPEVKRVFKKENIKF